MKKYKVKIKLKSIKPNPTYPSFGTKELIPYGHICSFTCHKLPDILTEDVNCEVISTGNGVIEAYLIGYDTSLIEKLNKCEEVISILIERKFVKISSTFEESKYLFKYKNPKIKCRYCEAKIKVSELLPYNTCPSCHEDDSVELKYESIEKALKRKQKKDGYNK